MSEPVWGEPLGGVRFGLVVPSVPLEAGGSVILELRVENRSAVPIQLFGFQPRYPRSLRVSPPRAERPYIRVSFGDTNVFHPSDAFMRLDPGGTGHTTLDLSFAFDRRGAGSWPIAFAYDPVRAGPGVTPWIAPGGEARTKVVELPIEGARALREAGIDDQAMGEIDDLLVRDPPTLLDDLRTRGTGALWLVARRVARTMGAGADAQLGWRALDALRRFGADGSAAIERVRGDLPHAAAALDFASALLADDRGEGRSEADLQFAAMLDRLVSEPGMRGNFLLSWTPFDSPVHGTRRLELFGSGQVLVSSRRPGDIVTSTRRNGLTSMQLEAVLEALRIAKVWVLRPLRAEGMPDEPRPSLEVQLALGEPFGRRVALWNGEWRQGPGARLADLLDRIAADGAGT